MKKYILTFLLVFLPISLSLNFVAEAASATPTNADIQQQINDLKNKIASRVAELNLVEKRGIIGTVTDVSDIQLTLSDVDGNTRIIDVDELTNFYSPSSKSFGISDIKNGETLGILGLYNKQSKRILARDVNAMSPLSTIIYGGINQIDGKNFEITVTKENGQKIVAEIENITKTFSFESGTLSRSGFSKMKETETVIVIGYPDKQDPAKILASRVILLPEIDLTSRINFGPAANPTVPPSTGSGVRLYPITK